MHKHTNKGWHIILKRFGHVKVLHNVAMQSAAPTQKIVIVKVFSSQCDQLHSNFGQRGIRGSISMKENEAWTMGSQMTFRSYFFRPLH